MVYCALNDLRGPPTERRCRQDLHRMLISSAWSYADLFADNKPGIALDVSDLSSMRVGINGSGGAPSVGDVVGLRLDKSRMGALTAAEFIAAQPEAGTLSENISAGSNPYVGSGLFVGRAINSSYIVSQKFTGLTPGTLYQVTVTIADDAMEAGNAFARFAKSTLGVDGLLTLGTGAGTYTTYVYPSVSIPGEIRFQCSPGNSVVITSYSIKAIPGTHAVMPADDARPKLMQDAGGRYYLDYDGVNDGWTVDVAGIPDNCSIFTALDPSDADTQYITFSDAAVSYAFAAKDADATATLSSGAGTPSYRIDGAAFSGSTRDDLHSAMLGGPHVASIIGADVSAWSTFKFSSYTSWQFAGREYGTIIVDPADTDAADIAHIEAWLAGKSGAVLP